MEVELMKKGDAEQLMRWIEEYADEEFASLLDEAEESTRRIRLR
jgi:hypothetical protein